MTEVKFTHTTYNTDVFVFADQVIAVLHLPTMKSTTLVGPGSTAIPVTDTVEEAIKKLTAAKAAAQPKESKNGVPKRKSKSRR